MITTESKINSARAQYMREWRAKNRDRARELARQASAKFRAKTKQENTICPTNPNH